MRAVKSPQLLRADEGPRRARHQRRPTCRPSRPTPRPRTTSSSSMRRRLRAGQDRLPPHGPKKSVPLGEAAPGRGARQHRARRALLASPRAWPAWSTSSPQADASQASRQASGGLTLKDLARGIVDALEPDAMTDREQATAEAADRSAARQAPLRPQAARADRRRSSSKNEQVIDTVTQDQVLEAGFSEAARERARRHRRHLRAVHRSSTRTRSPRCRSSTTARPRRR